MNCKKCNKKLEPDESFCTNCGEKNEEMNNTINDIQTSKKNSKVPLIIGIILGIVFLIFIIAYVLFKMPINVTTYNVIIEKASERNKRENLDEIDETKKYHKYRYSADLDISGKHFVDDDTTYIIYDGDKKLFEFNYDKNRSIKKLCKYTMNSSETFYDDSGCFSSRYFEFGYYDDIIVFGEPGIYAHDDFYIYDLKGNTLSKVLLKEEVQDFAIIDYDIDDTNSLIFKTSLSGSLNAEQYSGYKKGEAGIKSIGFRKYNLYNDVNCKGCGSYISTMDELERRLESEGFDDFVVERELIFTKSGEILFNL